jgi:hypothetical protein
MVETMTGDGEIVEGTEAPTTAIVKASKTTGIVKAMEDLKQVRTFVAAELVDGTDYGPIPGTGKVKVKRDGREIEVEKKVLLLSGAQKVGMFFNARPAYKVQPMDLGKDGHVEYIVETTLLSRSTGKEIGAGVGSCSTMESKYRYRKASRACPKCGKNTIIKGKKEYGGGFICWKKAGVSDGCGAAFKDDDTDITSQPEGRTANEDIWDQRNTVLKMAKKRSLVDASIGLGCLADLFTQDLEEDVYDLPKDTPDPKPPEPEKFEQRQNVEKPKPPEPPKVPAPKRPDPHAPPTKPYPTTDQLAKHSGETVQTDDPKLCKPCIAEARAGTGDGDVYFADECKKHAEPKPSEAKTRNFKFMEAMGKQKARVGRAAYYSVLGGAGYEHCSEITDRDSQKLAYKILSEMPDNHDEAEGAW